MDRPIKFRAFDANENMTHFSFADLISGHIPEPLATIIEREEWFTLMQYTGLTDSEGTPIYEGDVVEDEFGDRWLIQHGQHTVCDGDYYGEQFTAHGWYGENKGRERNLSQIHTARVVGNKYQHPHLLEEAHA